MAMQMFLIWHFVKNINEVQKKKKEMGILV